MWRAGALAALCILLLFIYTFVFTDQAKAHTSLTIAPEPELSYDASTVHGPKGAIMREARSYAGTTYQATSWNCSDYTKMVYGRAVGVWMPDWDEKQLYYGFHPSHLERGDLVFFDEVPHNHDRVSHVGVYGGKEGGRRMVWHNSSYYHKVVKTRMDWITTSAGNPAFVRGYTRRIR